jgi:pyruvate-ferredoxin/flavodoxin oxidoreductase
MESKQFLCIDGNEAACYVAYHLSEVIAIYPITPSSTMAELADVWANEGERNIWGAVPTVSELQSEGGAAGAIHGALQAGSLSTTFTASQGLLLMIPNMFKIAGELTPTVFHVSARSIAAQALSIFGDHSDVMATRQTGFALLASGSPQEVMDLACVAHKATLESRIPFLHFFDGFRTSHEINKIEPIPLETLKQILRRESILQHQNRALTPDHPCIRGTAQNPDVYFQGRESVNSFYIACPDFVQQAMDELAQHTGRSYHLFDYFGHPEATRVLVIMGSGAECAEETLHFLQKQSQEKIGLLKVRLYRPFSVKHFLDVLPKTVEKIAVLDRTKEPGALGEPLYLDVIAALVEGLTSKITLLSQMPQVIGGRYGLSSKEFTPAMVKAIFDELHKESPKNHFTIGIKDDVTHTSLDYDRNFSIEPPEVFQAMFYGLGSDGTVGANKNSIKIIGEETKDFVQGYFVYDSKKSGSTTVSHLRFGPHPIQSTYLIEQASFVACHQFSLLEKFEVLKNLSAGGIFLLNAPYAKEEVWKQLPQKIQQELLEKKVRFYAIDANNVAKVTGMGGRINTIMQTCFFAISGVFPQEAALTYIKNSIRKTYEKKGEEVVQKNIQAVSQTLEYLYLIPLGEATSSIQIPPIVSSQAPPYVREVLARILEGRGEEILVSQMPVDGTFPTATAQWEKRNIGKEVPVWDPEVCIQCGKCAFVCPHACIRIKAYEPQLLNSAPSTFKHTTVRGKEFPENTAYTIQVAVEDCTGCALCYEICPAKNKQQVKLKALNMQDQLPLRVSERENYDFFLTLPEWDRRQLPLHSVKGSQFLQPLFEFSGACAGCGETPYVKLVSQLFGDRALIANATGCSSIYGGNLPTTPWAKNKEGRGPAWSNSLFEDNAEFGFGMRLAIDQKKEEATQLLIQLKPHLDPILVENLLKNPQKNEADLFEQRERIEELKALLKTLAIPEAQSLLQLADYLTKKSIWLMGGDGWAYDIGFGGLDHVLASGKKVNILVLDTEVYSNTGGQTSKATGMGAVAKFSAGGKQTAKKDLALMAINYGNVYVARVAMGGNDTQTLKAFLEAEHYEGPSLILAYSHCIAHGINMQKGLDHQKAAVDSGYWPLFRFHPDLLREGKNPLVLDSKPPKIRLQEYAYQENRYRMLAQSHPEEAKRLMEQAQKEVLKRWKLYEHLASLDYSSFASSSKASHP